MLPPLSMQIAVELHGILNLIFLVLEISGT